MSEDADGVALDNECSLLQGVLIQRVLLQNVLLPVQGATRRVYQKSGGTVKADVVIVGLNPGNTGLACYTNECEMAPAQSQTENDRKHRRKE